MESKYVILSDYTKSGLERKVISYLESGYELAGGVQITVLGNDVRSNSSGLYHFKPEKWEYSQAVFKTSSENKRITL